MTTHTNRRSGGRSSDTGRPARRSWSKCASACKRSSSQPTWSKRSRPGQRASKTRLFDHVKEEELLGYGVPAEWMNDVRRATEDSLLDLADRLRSSTVGGGCMPSRRLRITASEQGASRTVSRVDRLKLRDRRSARRSLCGHVYQPQNRRFAVCRHGQNTSRRQAPYFGIAILNSVFSGFPQMKNRCNSFERERLRRIAGGGFEPPTSGL